METKQTFTFPLSFGQQRLWLLHQLEPGLALYNSPVACRLNGKLDVVALEQSLNEIVRRHEVLRTTFTMEDEQPLQVVHPALMVKLPVIDLRMYPPVEREAEIIRQIKEEAWRPFDLINGPLIRTLVLQSEPEEYVLLLTLHHIVFDDWSMNILYRELEALYNAYREGKPSPLPELPVQYADYAVWQREWQEKIFAPQLAYWKQQLKNAPDVFELPTDRPRPAVQTYKGATYSFVLSPELMQALNALSQQEEVTLFITLVAAFQSLLARYTRQDDILVGSPMINRNQVEVEGLFGFFLNMLVLRTNLAGNPTFHELLGRVREMVLDAYAHVDLPFERLVDGLQPRRDLSYTPLFQVMFALQNASTPDLHLSGLSATPLETRTGTSKFDLSLIIATGRELTCVFEYSTDLFDEATIAHMAVHFRTLLEGIVAHPDLPLANLPLLSPEEHQQLIVEWNVTATDYPSKNFHELFEEQVLKSPDAIAVIFEKQTLTYRVLNERANQLARYLQRSGVGPEVTVGICVERSLEMVVSLLGILKAGGVYVPLDPAYPEERLAFMLEDMGAPVLLTQQHLISKLATHRIHTICLDSDWEMIGQESTENLQCEVAAQNIAYVIYTSGSTGKPKGVMISHEALVNFLFSMRDQLHITNQHVMLATTSLSFDIAGLELYLPLLVGAQVVIVSQKMVIDGKQLAMVADTYESPIMQMTPSAWRMLIESGWRGSQKLQILCGGEALAPDLAHELLVRGASLVNLYGPTETTIWSTLHKGEFADPAIGLGQPIANTQLYILDAMMQPVPIGVPGELYIGGVGLARGYLKRPDLTAERFVPDPFSTEPGARLYKTGDLVRYRPNRNIEFLGRIDQQVKIHGYRIEPGEIEATLRQHPAVRDAVVMAYEDVPGDTRLVAYVLIDQETAPSILSLRDFLNARLPGYMVPSVLMYLDAFPLTPNGKVDRKSLPAPDHRRPELDRPYVAPRRPIEELFADIWSQVLEIEQIGVHDNFFDLGGDSIHSVQIAARMNQVGLAVLPRQLFQHQTIDRLVTDLTAHQPSSEQITKIERFLVTIRNEPAMKGERSL